VYDIISNKLYKHIHKFYPNYISRIKIIDTNTNYVYMYNNITNEHLNLLCMYPPSTCNNHLYYDITLWNKTNIKFENYLLSYANLYSLCINNSNFVINTISDTFIKNISDYKFSTSL
jgi:hypothetical protein